MIKTALEYVWDFFWPEHKERISAGEKYKENYIKSGCRAERSILHLQSKVMPEVALWSKMLKELPLFKQDLESETQLNLIFIKL